MAETSNTSSINIAIIGVHSLQNSMLFEAFMLMSENLADVYYQVDEDINMIDPVEFTSSLKFRFTQQRLIFRRNRGTMPHTVANRLLPSSDGVIVNLGGRILDINHLKSNGDDSFFPLLKLYVDLVCKAKAPAVFALEDVKDSFEPVEIYSKTERKGVWSTETKPATSISLNDDIWQPSSPTIKIIRDVFNIPDTLSVLPYSYRRPISLQNILTTLLADIEQGRVGGVSL